MLIAVVAVRLLDLATIAVVLPENVTVSPTSNSLVVAVYFKRGAVKSTTVPVALLTLLVNVSSSVIVLDTVLRTAYLGKASVGADVKLIPCSTIFNDVAFPISSPYGITVPSAPSKAISDISFDSRKLLFLLRPSISGQ